MEPERIILEILNACKVHWQVLGFCAVAGILYKKGDEMTLEFVDGSSKTSMSWKKKGD